MKTKVFLLILISLLCFSSLDAQKKKKNVKITISGQVVDARQYPVSNAIIMIDGKNTNSITDAQGNYKIKIKQGVNTLGVVSFANGMIEEEINGRTVINFKYGGDPAPRVVGQQQLQEEEGTITDGYDYKREKNLTNRVKNIDGKAVKNRSYQNVYEMISRECAGVRVNGSRVIIEGSKDLFGDVEALLVVDGVPVNDLSTITPTEVESISVLKGSAAAIYGSRGYGGAIVVTTKKENK